LAALVGIRAPQKYSGLMSLTKTKPKICYLEVGSGAETHPAYAFPLGVNSSEPFKKMDKESINRGI
jgi:hypothetical protein